jgi:hypothetical protein
MFAHVQIHLPVVVPSTALAWPVQSVAMLQIFLQVPDCWSSS